MGFFSTKKKRFYDTSLVRVIEDDRVPNIIQTAMYRSLFSGRDFTPVLKESLVGASFRNFKKMYNFAERGDYFYGLPDVRLLKASDGFELAKAQIETEVGFPVTLKYMHFRPLNNIHMGLKHLEDNLGYDPISNEVVGLLRPEGWKVYLEKLVAVHETAPGLEPEEAALGNWGRSTQAGYTPRRPGLGDNALGTLVQDEELRVGESETESVEIHTMWYDEDTSTYHDEFTVLDLSSYDGDQEYYQAKYTYTDGSGQEHAEYWFYDPEVGSNTALNTVFDPGEYTAPGTYFPITVFRKSFTDQTATALQDTEAFTSTTEMLDILGLDYAALGESINENPDVNFIKQAVMMMGVPIVSQNPIDMDYLFNYFRSIGTITPDPPGPTEGSNPRLGNDLNSTPSESFAVEISDADFRLVMSYDAIRVRIRAGSIGDVGTVTNVMGPLSVYDLFTEGGQGPSGYGNAIPSSEVRTFSKQLTETTYEEIRVINPRVRYPIRGESGSSATGTDDTFLVPLDAAIVNQVNFLDRESLYHRSLYFVFNSQVTQKTKWYQTGLFKAVLFIIAIVITIYNVKLGIEAFAMAQTLTIAIQQLIIQIVITAAITEVIVEVVKLVGVDIAAILAVIAFIASYGKYQGIFDFIKFSAIELLSLGNGLISAINQTQAQAFSDYSDEFAEFAATSKTKWEELEAANKLLDTNPGILDLGLITRQVPLIVVGESPEAYYNRTIHSGNVGVQTLKFIQNYVPISLKLPEVKDTTKDFLYV
tara:strand:+ start:11670 stop:13949 length:2280 start_codon:yes stop_codon:yes gene_type:complete